MISYLLLIAFTLIILHIGLRYRRFGRLIHQIPGPRGLPLIGNVLRGLFAPTNKLWITIHEWQKQYPILKLWSGHLAFAFTRDPDHMKVLLSCKKNINKEVRAYATGKCIGHNGIVTSGGKLWEKRRKILNQAFTPNMLEFYSKKIDACSKKLMNQLLTYDNDFVIDVLPIFNKVAFAVACETILDYNIDEAMEQKGKKFRDAVHEISQIVYYRIYRPYIQDWMMTFLPIGRRQAVAVKNIEDFSNKVIKERRNYLTSRNKLKDYLDNIENCNENDVKESKKKFSVLDILLLSEEKGLINSRGILDETTIMIGVSYESTATALTFFSMALAENKEVQDLARQEILETIGGYGNVITMEHIKKLDYLERCAKESLRLYTTVPFHGRSIDEEVKLGEYTIPVGMEMYFNIFQLHRDPNLWPDPLKFDPDRFLPENLQEQHPFAYLPFSRGPRSCLGQKFAMTEIKTVMAHILYNYYLEPVDRSIDFEFDLGITLKVDKTRVEFVKLNQM